MHAFFTNLFPQASVNDNDALAAWKRQFIELFSLIGFLTCLITGFIPNSQYNTLVLLFAGACFAVLGLAFRRGLNWFWAVNLIMLVASSLLLYLIFVTGGTASVLMIWIAGLSLMPFILLSKRVAITWLFLHINALFMILLASQAGWIDTQSNTTKEMVLWAFANKMLGAITLIVILDFLDNSQQKQLEKLQMRGHELRNIHQELIRAQSHKDEFIASVGHELRTPMNAILGFNAVLRDQVNTSAEDEQRVDMIRESTQHLLALINDILDFSQLQAQRMQLGQEPYALHIGFEEIAQRLNRRAIEKKLQAICSLDPLLPHWVLMDHKRFSQLIDNLLDNALKFTNHGHIALHFKSCELGLRIEVEDSGIGMTPEQASHIFGRFEKVSMDPVHLYGGTGLGLSICEKLVQLQNGRIGVSSTLNQGSLFWVELPLLLTEAPHALIVEGESSGALNNFPSVFLVVDDQAVNLLVAQRLLQKIWPDCRVHTTTSGQEALLWLKANSVDMVLMDMFMPDMDGLEATHHIRSLDTPVKNVRIIGLTASSNSNDHKQCLEAGMNDIVFKPLEQDALQTCVMRCWRTQP